MINNDDVVNIHLWSIKQDIRQNYKLRRLGSSDCGVKRLVAVGESRWIPVNRPEERSAFIQKAANALEWLDGSCQGAWRYAAQDGWLVTPPKGGIYDRIRVARHRVQFEREDQVLLFKLSWA